MAVLIRHADNMAPSSRKKLALTSPTSCGRSVGIIRLQTEATDFSLVLVNVLTLNRALPKLNIAL
jgi:hypothetical protein